MQKSMLFLLVSLFPAMASAQWHLFSEHPDQKGYYNSTSLVRNGNLVKMWSLVDFSEAQVIDGYPYMSTISLSEFDCQQRMLRGLQMSFYTGRMGGGRSHGVVNLSGGWKYTIPGSDGARLLTFACQK